MCVATYLKSGSPSAPHGTPSPSSLTTRYCEPRSRPRSMTTVLARASMLFSTNSAMAFRGLLWERAMMRMAFQSSPIRSLPLSDALLLAALFFVTGAAGRASVRTMLSRPAINYIEDIACGQSMAVNRPQKCRSLSGKVQEAKHASNSSALRCPGSTRPLSDAQPHSCRPQ